MPRMAMRAQGGAFLGRTTAGRIALQGVSFRAYDSQPTRELRTPYAARESNEDAECFGVVLGAGVRFETF